MPQLREGTLASSSSPAAMQLAGLPGVEEPRAVPWAEAFKSGCEVSTLFLPLLRQQGTTKISALFG